MSSPDITEVSYEDFGIYFQNIGHHTRMIGRDTR